MKIMKSQRVRVNNYKVKSFVKKKKKKDFVLLNEIEKKLINSKSQLQSFREQYPGQYRNNEIQLLASLDSDDTMKIIQNDGTIKKNMIEGEDDNPLIKAKEFFHN